MDRKFIILVIIVSISGFSQGMLLPLISVIFEGNGVSSTLNGLNATGLYIGTLLIAPFTEHPLRKYGYKPMIIVGGILIFISLLLFPVWKSAVFWFILRMFIGVGDHTVHYATQTWITSTTEKHKLGRNMSIYGISFSAGFAVGPLFVPLIKISESLPFIVSSILCFMAWTLIFLLRNEKPEALIGDANQTGVIRYKRALKYGWIAFLPPFTYGFLETSLNAVYPVYAMRKEYDLAFISIILASFTVGGVLMQFPLGILGDKIGRKKVITSGLLIGSSVFFLGSFLEANQLFVAGVFLFAGMFVGSMFGLGITYMTDLTPKELLPTGNLLCGIFFSLGSLTGPFLGGFYLQKFPQISFLLLISSLLIFVCILVFLFGKGKKEISLS